MKKDEQIKFVASLTASIRRDIITEIDAGNVPETWDGFELRQWLADKFKASTYPMHHKRKAEYENYILVNNL